MFLVLNLLLIVVVSFPGLNTDKSPSESVIQMMAEIRHLQDMITKFKAMQVDPTEFACLKGIVIFKTGKCHNFIVILHTTISNSRPKFCQGQFQYL